MKTILRSKEQGSTTINIYVQGVSNMTMLINSIKSGGGTIQVGDNCCSGNVNMNGEPVKFNIKPVKNTATTQCPMAGTCDRCDKCMYCDKKAQVGFAVPFLRTCEQAGVKNNNTYSLVSLEQYRTENACNSNSTAKFILKIDEKSITYWHDAYISFKFKDSDSIWILDTQNGNMARVKSFENVPKIIDKDIAGKKEIPSRSVFETLRTIDESGHLVKKFANVANVTFHIERVVALLADVKTGYVMNDYTGIDANVMDLSGGSIAWEKLRKYCKCSSFSRFKHNNIEWCLHDDNPIHGNKMYSLITNIVYTMEAKLFFNTDLTTEQKDQIADAIMDITEQFPKISAFDGEALSKITTLSRCGDFVELEKWLKQNIPAL